MEVIVRPSMILNSKTILIHCLRAHDENGMVCNTIEQGFVIKPNSGMTKKTHPVLTHCQLNGHYALSTVHIISRRLSAASKGALFAPRYLGFSRMYICFFIDCTKVQEMFYKK